MNIFRKIYQKIFNENMKNYDAETKIFDELKNNLTDEKSTTEKVNLAIQAIENVIDSRNGWKEEKFKGLQSLYDKLSKAKTLYEQVKILAKGSGTGWGTSWNLGLRSMFKTDLKNIENDEETKPVSSRQKKNGVCISDTEEHLNKLIEKNKKVLNEKDFEFIDLNLCRIDSLKRAHGDISQSLNLYKKAIEECINRALFQQEINDAIKSIKQKMEDNKPALDGNITLQLTEIIAKIKELRYSENIKEELSKELKNVETIINNSVQKFRDDKVRVVQGCILKGMEVYEDITEKEKTTISELQNTSNSVKECQNKVKEFCEFIIKRKKEINDTLENTKQNLRNKLKEITQKYSGSKTWSMECSKYEHEIYSALNKEQLSDIEKNLTGYVTQNSEKLQKEKQEYDTEQNIIKKKEQNILFQYKKQQAIVNMNALLSNNNLNNCIAVKQKLDSATSNINKINPEDKDSENKLNKVFEEFKQYINAEQKQIYEYSQKNIKIIEQMVSELKEQILINKDKLTEKANTYKNQIRCLSIEEQDKKMNEWNSFIQKILQEENSEKSKNQEAYLKKQLESIKKPLKNLYEFKAHHDNFKNSVIKQLLKGLNLLLQSDKGLSSLIKDKYNEELLSNKEELGKIMKSGKIQTITMNYLYFISDIMDAVDNYDSLAASNKQDDTNKSSTMKKGKDKDSIKENYLEEELYCKNKFNDNVENVQMNGNYSEIINEMKKIVNGNKYIENHSELYTPLINALNLLREEVLTVTVESKNKDDPNEITHEMYLKAAKKDFDSNLMTLVNKANTFTLNLTKNVNDCLNKLKYILKNDGISGVWCKKSPSKTFREMILVNYIDYLLNSQKTGMPMWNIKSGKPEIKLSDIQQQNYRQTHYVGDCWLLATLKSIISSKPDLILECFPNRKEEINEKGEIVGNNITVRFFEVQLSAHIKNKDYLRIYCRAIKPVELILNTKLSNVGNISDVAWPNFIEKAMAIYRSKHLVKIGGNGDAELNNGHHYEYGRIGGMSPITYLECKTIRAWENPKEGPLEFGNKIGVGRLNNFGDDGGLTYSILTGKNGGHKRADVRWSNEYQSNNNTNENEQEFKKILEILKDASKKETTTIHMNFKENTITAYGDYLFKDRTYYAVNNTTDASGKQNILVLKTYDNNVHEVNVDVNTFTKYLDRVDYSNEKNLFQQFEMQYEMLLKRLEKNPNIPAIISFDHHPTYKNGEPNSDYYKQYANPFKSGDNYLYIKHAYMVKEITKDYIIVEDPRNSQEIKVLRDDVIDHFQDISFGKVE